MFYNKQEHDEVNIKPRKLFKDTESLPSRQITQPQVVAVGVPLPQEALMAGRSIVRSEISSAALTSLILIGSQKLTGFPCSCQRCSHPVGMATHSASSLVSQIRCTHLDPQSKEFYSPVSAQNYLNKPSHIARTPASLSPCGFIVPLNVIPMWPKSRQCPSPSGCESI